MSKKAYLMTSGTLLPAFVGVGIIMAVKGQAKLGVTELLIFAGLSVAGGYITAKLLTE
jgi:hypothetical protein